MIPLFIKTPVRGSSTLLPNGESKVWVRLTMLPAASTAHRWVVQLSSWAELWPMVLLDPFDGHLPTELNVHAAKHFPHATGAQ